MNTFVHACPDLVMSQAPPKLSTHRHGSLSDAAWRKLAKEFWERVPTVLNGVMPQSLLSEQELLRVLVAAADAHRAGSSDVPFVMWVDRRKLGDPGVLLPSAEDKLLHTYLGRVDRAVHGREFTLLLANPHLFDEEVREKAAAMVEGMFPHVGIPCGGVDTGIFLGHYGKTPFGVHRGQMSVLTFPVVGTKRILLWERGYGETHADIRDALSYDRHLMHSMEVSASAGDVMYWPADYWHIADNKRSFTAAFNIGLWWDKSPLQRAVHALGEALAAQLRCDHDHGLTLHAEDGRAVCMPLRTESNAALPQVLQDMAQTVNTTVTGGQFASAMQTAWLAERSGSGFRDLVPLRPVTIDPKAALMLAPISGRRLWSEVLPNGQFAIATQGHVITLPNSTIVADAIAALQSGNELTLYISHSSDEQERRALQDAAAFLLGSGAVRQSRTQQG